MIHDREILVIRRPGWGVRGIGIAAALLSGVIVWQASYQWPLTSIVRSLAFSFQMVAALPGFRLAFQLLRGGWEVRIDLRNRTVTRRHRSLRPRWNDTYSLDDFQAVERRNIRDNDVPLTSTTAWLVGPNAEVDLFEPPEVPSELALHLVIQRLIVNRWPLPTGEEIARRCGLPFREAVEPVEIHGEFLQILYPGEPVEPIPCPEIGDVLTIRRNAGFPRFLGLFIVVDCLVILGIDLALVAGGAANPIEPGFAAFLSAFAIPMTVVGLAIFTYRSEIIIDRAARTFTQRWRLFSRKRETTRPLDDFSEVYLLKVALSPVLPAYLNVQFIGPGANIQIFNASCVPRVLLGPTRRLRRFDRVQRAAGALADFCSFPFRSGSLDSVAPSADNATDASLA